MAKIGITKTELVWPGKYNLDRMLKEERLRREINPHVYWPDEFARALSEKQGFLGRVLAGPKIFLIGDADELGKVVGDRAAEAA